MASDSDLWKLAMVTVQCLGSYVSDSTHREAFARAVQTILAARRGDEAATKLVAFAVDQKKVLRDVLAEIEGHDTGAGATIQ